MSSFDLCTDACEASPECSRCHLRKAPRGRSVPLEAANGYCSWDCPGYTDDPQPGHLWPGERRRAIEDCGGEA